MATSVSIWRGNNYVTGEQQATTLRFDQADNWSYGDSFFFFEVANPDDNGTAIYGEWQPRISFSKLFNHKIAFGPISDVLIASEINVSGANTRAYLYGLGVNLKIPGFNFTKLNTYVRHNPAQPGSTYQVSLTWSAPIKFGQRVQLEFAGFIDQAGKQGNISSNFLAKPRLLLDFGNLVFHHPNSLYIGTQYVYWHNKLGISGLHESVLEAMLTWKL